MNANALQKATKLLASIHDLDKEIVAIEKKANKIADGEKFVNIELSFQEDKPEKPVIDTDGFDSMYKSILGYSGFGYQPLSVIPKDTLKFNLSDTETLFVLGALIQVKKEKRKQLCQLIIDLGVTI